jgi:hypothetical protein
MISSPEPASPALGAARRGHHPAVALAVIAASQLMVVLDPQPGRCCVTLTRAS